MDPATAVLHYAQEIFEGLKAYKHPDGSVWTFRPQANAARFARSAFRLALPPLSEASTARLVTESGGNPLALLTLPGAMDIDDVALWALSEEPLDVLCDRLLSHLLPDSGADDVALVAVRAHPEDQPRPAEAGPVRVPPPLA